MSDTVAEVLPAKFVSPPYWAVMLWDPAPREEVENEAVPELSDTEPREVAPSKNVTVLVGVPAVDVTVTEKVRV